MKLVDRMFQPLPITKMSSMIDNFIFSDSDNEDYIVQIEELMLRKQKDNRKHAQCKGTTQRRSPFKLIDSPGS